MDRFRRKYKTGFPVTEACFFVPDDCRKIYRIGFEYSRRYCFFS